MEKYLIAGKVIYKLNQFDPRIKYTFINDKYLNNITNCPNCGAMIKQNSDECEYCNTYYNIDYNEKDLGSKYQYDMTIHSNKYIILTLIIDIIVSLCFMFTYFYKTGRTFNMYDIAKATLSFRCINYIITNKII